MDRRGLSLLEIVIAVVILAVIGGPILANMIMAKRSLHSSTADVRAVIEAGKLLERLTGQPYARIPTVSVSARDVLDGEAKGVPRSAWRAAFPTVEGKYLDLVELLGDTDPEGHADHVWIETLEGDRLGFGWIRAKEITVTVEYQASGPDIDKRRRLSMRTVVAEPVP